MIGYSNTKYKRGANVQQEYVWRKKRLKPLTAHKHNVYVGRKAGYCGLLNSWR